MRSDSNDTIVDTNIAVYSVDPSNPIRRVQAEAALDRLENRGTGFISVQCLNEFYSSLRKPRGLGFTHARARQEVLDLHDRFRVLNLTPEITFEAMNGVERYQLQWWDALLWATAKLNGIATLLSEDFNNGAVLDSVRFLNPFLPSFDLATL